MWLVASTHRSQALAWPICLPRCPRQFVDLILMAPFTPVLEPIEMSGQGGREACNCKLLTNLHGISHEEPSSFDDHVLACVN